MKIEHTLLIVDGDLSCPICGSTSIVELPEPSDWCEVWFSSTPSPHIERGDSMGGLQKTGMSEFRCGDCDAQVSMPKSIVEAFIASETLVTELRNGVSMKNLQDLFLAQRDGLVRGVTARIDNDNVSFYERGNDEPVLELHPGEVLVQALEASGITAERL